jgi:hypothetical protein
MKLIASLIIAVSLVVGVIGAMTAYLAPLHLPDEELIGLELNADAGINVITREPLARRKDIITPELLQALRQQGVKRVQVKEFALQRWTGWPLFVLGAAGLLVGAVLLRRTNRRAIVLQTGPLAEAADEAHAEGPDAHFRAIRRGLEQLQNQLPMLPPADQLRAVIEILGESQRTHVPAFIAARPQLTARLGLAGYAQLMDSFAAAERQLNRAWSAAADGVLDEAVERVHNAALLFDQAAAKLRP